MEDVKEPRMHNEGAFYQVVVRGNNRVNIFKSIENKEKYKKIVLKYKRSNIFKSEWDKAFIKFN